MAKILIIYTGGTIGMKPSTKGYEPDPKFADKVRKDIGKIKDIPEFDIMPLNPLLDSSNMIPSDWDTIAKIIKNEYDKYDGFIVLHGTDTMAYTASALSFMLEELNKTVIITGSQIPYCEVRNDARENLITSLIICSNYKIPEVTLYFNNKLFRGCRCTKVDATHFDAFDSPNYPPLAEIGVTFDFRKQTTLNVKVNSDLIKPVDHQALADSSPLEVCFFDEFEQGKEYDVGVLRLFPGISARYVKQILQPPLKGLVLETFGVGNGPSKERNPELVEAIRYATEELGIVIVAVTQCLKGTVISGQYATSLGSIGIIFGYDITVEAALTKLYYLISCKGFDMEKVKKEMQEDLRGELTRDKKI